MKTYYSIFVALLFASCSKTPEKKIVNLEKIIVDDSKINPDSTEVLKVSSIATGVEYIPLKFNKELKDSLIGNPDMFFVVGNHYILADRRITKSIFCVNTDGTVHSTIARVGAGPGEYLKIEDISVSENAIKVYDSEQQKIITYDFEGKFIDEAKTPFNFFKFSEHGNSKFLFTKFLDNRDAIDDDQNYRLLITDKDNNVINKFFPFSKKLMFSQVKSLSGNFYKYGDSCTFIHPLNDTIFRVTDKDLIPRYKVTFPSSPLPDGYVDNEEIFNKVKDVEKNKYVTLAGGIQENDKLLIFYYSFNRAIYTSVYNKKTKATLSYITTKNDFDNFYTPPFKALDDGALYTVINPSSMDYEKMFERDKTSPRFTSVYNKNGKEMGNPIIVKYLLK